MHVVCVYSIPHTHLKLADSTIDGSVQGSIQLHGEGIGGLAGVAAYPRDDRP